VFAGDENAAAAATQFSNYIGRFRWRKGASALHFGG
jgi:hypothetical protein